MIKRTKMHRDYTLKTKRKISLIYRNNRQNDCIFIFPSEIKNKSINIIFEKYI